MSYKIAITSSDEISIDQHFGQTDNFLIYQIEEDGSYQKVENRIIENESYCEGEGRDLGCASGCGGHTKSKKINTILDCRCVLCSQCGIGAERDLGKQNITAFIITLPIDEAITRVIEYYKKLKPIHQIK